MDEWYRELKVAGTRAEFEINQAIKAEINQREVIEAYKTVTETIMSILQILTFVLLFVEFLNQRMLIEHVS
ncbi:hypothetical protein AS034_17690 [[Bacillus] enclensis]|uniref:Uncharacterized protein n=1 Tax=[Bacillus] enclensis TaxID=1402860 RepID=A0A0V8HB48_9BACI|nr:hypothetical protein [[Bacillus] enclensis]KSU59864.1 hypothetical protein AS034_17690 [[Bacillus] enclensis]SCC28142.1 hypothetical protein GA0061094_3663 [[Bacillus] enclensis]